MSVRQIRLVAALATLLAAGTAAPAQEVKKHALFVGINAYDHSKFRNLEFAENDAAAMTKLLGGGGWQVSTLIGAKAGLQEIRDALRRITQKRTRHDVVLVGLAGHGLFFPDQNGSYFCPKDAEPHRSESMLPLSEVYRELADCGAGAKLLLVDACREEAVRGLPRTRGMDTALQAPEGVGVLFSCSPGQFAFESPEYKHGVFFYHVLAGFKGKAKDAETGEVTWDLMRAYVKSQVARDVARLYPGGKQVPQSVESLADVPPLLKLANFIAIPQVPVRKPAPEVKIPIVPPPPTDALQTGAIFRGNIQQDATIIPSTLVIQSRTGANFTGEIALDLRATNHGIGTLRLRGSIAATGAVTLYTSKLSGEVTAPGLYEGRLQGSSFAGTWQVPSFQQRGRFQYRLVE